MASEIENKYEVPADFAVDDRLAVDGVRLGEPQRHELSAVYYDTSDLRLAADKVALRRRTGGHDAGWHVKRYRGAGEPGRGAAADGPRRRGPGRGERGGPRGQPGRGAAPRGADDHPADRVAAAGRGRHRARAGRRRRRGHRGDRRPGGRAALARARGRARRGRPRPAAGGGQAAAQGRRGPLGRPGQDRPRARRPVAGPARAGRPGRQQPPPSSASTCGRSATRSSSTTRGCAGTSRTRCTRCAWRPGGCAAR